MNNWEIKDFKDIAQFPPKVNLQKGIPCSFIPMEKIDGLTKYVFPNQERVWSGSGGAKFQDGDTLFARITPCLQNGKIAQAKNLKNGFGFGSTEYFIFRGINGVSDTDFIYYLSKTDGFRQNAIGSMVGASGRQRADASFVGQYQVNLPPLPTQTKIAKVLSTYDNLIELNLKRIKLLEELAKATYEEWFIHMRFPNHENIKVDSETGLPEGWMIKLNKDCCNVSGGGTPSTTINEYWDNGDVTWFSPTDLSKSKSLFLSESSSRITKSGLKGSSAKLLDKNSFMMTSRATIGLFGLVDNDFCTNQGFINITPFKKEHKYFLLYNLKSRVPEFLNYASGATFLELSKSKFNSLKTVWPNESVINSFHDLCEPVIQLVINLTKENDRLKEARDILLPRLMAGVIDVDDFMKEAA